MAHPTPNPFDNLDASIVEAVEQHATVMLGAIDGARGALELAAFHHPGTEDDQ